jgi:tRNA (mo5U34)-methyltransferase
MSRETHSGALCEAAAALGPWFHNIDLGGGAMTAPEHFLGDYPAVKWRRFADAIPADLSGRTVLDIGCNAGFYSLQMKARGASRVLGIDVDPDYLRQARFAADTIGVEIEFAEMSVYDVAALGEQFDVVLFLGVLYHLRHPLLALDLIREHVVRDLFVCQSLQRGDPRDEPLEEDYPFSEWAVFERPGFPRLSFIEHCYSGDPTNWWVPNRACTAAMLRSAGFRIEANPDEEVFVCHAAEPSAASGAVYPARIRSDYKGQAAA